MLVVTRKTFPAKEITCELASVTEIGEAEAVLRKFYFEEFKNVDPHLVNRIAGRKDENLIREQTEIAFIHYFETHTTTVLHTGVTLRNAITAALNDRAAEMEEEV
jgi:hypothetical protein